MADYTENDNNEEELTAEQQADKALIETSLKRFDLEVDAEREMRQLALEDLRFRGGDQWPAEIKTAREAKGRPCLTINVLPARERQILNDQRQNRPAIKVSPVDDLADKDTAKVFQGVIRHIEYDSDADVAYDTGTASAVRGGRGYFRVVAEYESPFSLNQVLKIKRVRNPFSIYFDPNCQQPDYSDAKFAHVFCDYSKEEYKAEFGQDAADSLDQWRAEGDAAPEWLPDGGVRVVEYWYIDSKKDTLYLLKDGSTKLKSQLPEQHEELLALGSDGKPVSRETEVPVVRCCIHNAQEVLDKKEWAGRWIPIIPVLGDELEIDGKLILEGMVRHAKDVVYMANVMASAQMETIGLIPKAPWLVAEGQIEDYKIYWEQANTDLLPYLPYKPVSLDNEPVPPPQRLVAEPAVGAITQARLQFNDDLKAITGIYDAQLGARSNETSGKGILARQQQGQIGNFHYTDNLTRAIRHCGRILIDLIPKIYDTARVLRIIGEDGTADTALVNAHLLPEDDPRRQQVKHIYDLSVGTYDVTVAAGPSYQTRRQEAVASILDVIRANPTLFSIVGDLLVKNMDWPGAEQIAERLKKGMPPQFQDDSEDPAAVAAKAKAQLGQLSQQHEMITKALNDANEIIKGKRIEQETKMQVEQLHSETQLAIAEIQTKAQDSGERKAFIEDLETLLLKHQHAMELQHEQHQHEVASEVARQATMPPAPEATDTTAQPGQ